MNRNTKWALMVIGVALLTVFAPRGAGAQSALERLSVHGHLTQAFGMSERNQYLGIPETGTADYRAAALLFRYAATDDDHIVLQFSHERFGRSPIVPEGAELEVDWVFYQRDFGSATSLRVGKVPLPTGIFNEIRDVGTLLPFYRPPNVVYLEKGYTTEALNGVVVSHTFADGSPWSVGVDAYFGNWKYLQYEGSEAEANKAFGGRVWVNTPVPGVRVGGGVQRFEASNIAAADPDATDDFFVWHTAVDADVGPLVVRGEFVEAQFFQDFGGHYRGYYAQVGVRATPKLMVMGQAERSDLRFPLFVPQLLIVETEFDRDLAAGISYAFLPTLVVKAEHHWYRGYNTEDPQADIMGPPAKTMYTLLSVSVSY
jgi:hypothetical protein